MLEKFWVKNYLSFRDKAEVSFISSSITEIPKNLINTPFAKYSLLKGIGVFGLNSSGKSNLFKSIQFAKDIILGKTGGIGSDNIEGVLPFAFDTNSKESPSEFEFVFWVEHKKFRYYFKLTKREILEEALFVKESQKEKYIYIRSNSEFQIGREFKKDVEKFTGKIRPNELFITFAGRLYLDFAEEVITWFRNMTILIEYNTKSLALHTVKLIENTEYRMTLEKIMTHSGFGIESIKLLQAGSSKTIQTKHTVYKDNKFYQYTNLDLFLNESLGTLKYFGLIGSVVETVTKGGLLIIDEFDSGFHTLLGTHLVNLFNKSLSIEKKSQLMFSTHNLDFWSNETLRRDQQLHLDKDEFGRSYVKTTYKYKLRKDKSVKKSMLKGDLVKIPVFSNIQLTIPFE